MVLVQPRSTRSNGGASRTRSSTATPPYLRAFPFPRVVMGGHEQNSVFAGKGQLQSAHAGVLLHEVLPDEGGGPWVVVLEDDDDSVGDSVGG